MRLSLLLLATAVSSAPAFADHAGPTGVGGGVAVLGPDTLDEGHASAGLRVTYARPDQRSETELEALAAKGIHAHNTDYNLNASLGLAYGITHQLTISVELPYVRRDDLREAEDADAVARLGSVAGLGDLSLLAKYRVTHSESGGLAIVAGIKAPSGSTHQHSADGERLETEHQPGTGSWDPIIGASGGVKLGGLQLTASTLYQFSGNGAQHTRLGDRAQGGIALSHRFGPAEHHDHDDADEDHHGHGEHEHAAPHGHQSWEAFVELSGEWEGRQAVAGEIEQASGGKSVWLTPGARFNAASGFSIAGALGVPLWQNIRDSHPNNDYRLTLSVGHAF